MAVLYNKINPLKFCKNAKVIIHSVKFTYRKIIHILFETKYERRIFVIYIYGFPIIHVNTGNFHKTERNITMNISKENAAYCDVLKIELSRNDINTGFNPNDCIYMRPVAAFLLAIIKSSDIEIQNEIGKIFKGHNIIDYTYFDKTLNIEHIYKTLAYTSLYKASGFQDNYIKADDVTITIISMDTPQQLFDSLKESSITVDKSGKGIYQIKNMMPFAIQVIVRSEMRETEQDWLHSLIEYVQNDFLPRLMLLGLDQCSKMLI